MSDIPFPPQPDSPLNGGAFVAPGDWAVPIGDRHSHTFTGGTFRPRPNLPIYCNPIFLFLTVWVLMLGCLSVHVSYVIYPALGTPFVIFLVATASFLLGFYASTAILGDDITRDAASSYTLDVTLLWRLNALFCAFALALMAFNWLTDGPPPAIGDPTSYLVYGKLKQILFPLLTCIAVNATLDSSRIRRYLFIAFGLGGLILYVARGIVLVAFLQMFFLFSLRSSMSRRKQYLLAAGAVVIAIAGMTIIGDLRTAHDIFIEFLQIRDKYSDWPTAFLWFVSYISIPFSNLCWIVAHPSSHGPTTAFLYSLLPSFMAPADPYADVYGSTNIIDNASTYLQAFALDFSYFGIYFANLIIGVGCGWLVTRAYPRNVLILAIFLTSISLLFFTDMFFLLSTIIQVALQSLAQKRCFAWSS